MKKLTDIYGDYAKEAASQEQDAEWEIEVGEVYSSGEHGGKAINIVAVKEGDESQALVLWLDANTGAAGIEEAARTAVVGIARLNAGLASARPGIREKLLDVIETIKGESK